MISRLKSDISQAEFVASVSHEDLENKLDSIDTLRSKVVQLEEEVILERNRTILFKAPLPETSTVGTNTILVYLIFLKLGTIAQRHYANRNFTHH